MSVARERRDLRADRAPPLRAASARWGALWFGFARGHAAVLLAPAVGAGRDVRRWPRCSRCSAARPWLAAALAVARARWRAPSPARSWRWSPSPTPWPTARTAATARSSRPAGLLPPLVLTAAFPEGGYHPFVFSSFFDRARSWRSRPSRSAAPRDRDAADRLRAVRARRRRRCSWCTTPFGGNTVRLGPARRRRRWCSCAVAGHAAARGALAGGAVGLSACSSGGSGRRSSASARKVADDPSTRRPTTSR